MKPACDEENVCVFVANLPAFLSNSELTDRVTTILGPFGKIYSVKTSRDVKNRPFAFVQFEGPVIDFLLTEMVMLEDRVLRFERAKSTFHPDKTSNINNISISNDESRISHGHGYVDGVYYPHMIPYYPHFDPRYPISLYQPAAYPSSIECPESRSSSSSASLTCEEGANKIFVSHLNGELVTQRKLLRRFQQYGHITDIELFKNNLDGTLRQEAFAFISYLKIDQMLEAIKAENGSEWLGRHLKCCKALKKRDKISETTAGTVEVESVDVDVNVNGANADESAALGACAISIF